MEQSNLFCFVNKEASWQNCKLFLFTNSKWSITEIHVLYVSIVRQTRKPGSCSLLFLTLLVMNRSMLSLLIGLIKDSL